MEYPGKRYRGKYAYEHHILYWRQYGLVLSKGSVLHHKNGIKHDNRIENLEILEWSEHTQQHRIIEEVVFNCSNCGRKHSLKPSIYRKRMKCNEGRVFCSRRCGVIAQHIRKKN